MEIDTDIAFIDRGQNAVRRAHDRRLQQRMAAAERAELFRRRAPSMIGG